MPTVVLVFAVVSGTTRVPAEAFALAAMFDVITTFPIALAAPFKPRASLIALALRGLLSLAAIVLIVVFAGGTFFLFALSNSRSTDGMETAWILGVAVIIGEVIGLLASIVAIIALATERRRTS